MRSLRSVFIGFVLLATGLISSGSSFAVLPYEFVVLPLQGEGTAMYMHLPEEHTLFLIDCGKRGEKGGAPDIKALLARIPVNQLIIQCSHPDSDHLDGFVDLLQDRALFERHSFDSLKLLDNGKLECKTLSAIFSEGPAADLGINWGYKEVLGEDVLHEISKNWTNVECHNLPILDKSTGRHSDAIVSMFEFTNPGNGQFTIVDFDDAETDRVDAWYGWLSESMPDKRIDVVIMPHHGSEHTNIDHIVFKSSPKTRVIFTSNQGNRYGHPHPVNLEKMVRRVGWENIFITGAEGRIRIEDGVVSHSNSIDSQRNFWNDYIAYHLGKLNRKTITPSREWTKPQEKVLIELSALRRILLYAETLDDLSRSSIHRSNIRHWRELVSRTDPFGPYGRGDSRERDPSLKELLRYHKDANTKDTFGNEEWNRAVLREYLFPQGERHLVLYSGSNPWSGFSVLIQKQGEDWMCVKRTPQERNIVANYEVGKWGEKRQALEDAGDFVLRGSGRILGDGASEEMTFRNIVFRETVEFPDDPLSARERKKSEVGRGVRKVVRGFWVDRPIGDRPPGFKKRLLEKYRKGPKRGH